jgi:hypothetical protein
MIEPASDLSLPSLNSIYHRLHHSFLHSFHHSLLGLFILFILYVVGAAYASHLWHDLDWCYQYFACRLLTALVAFAWGCAVITGLLWLLELWWVATKHVWGRPLHGHEDERRGRWF